MRAGSRLLQAVRRELRASRFCARTGRWLRSAATWPQSRTCLQGGARCFGHLLRSVDEHAILRLHGVQHSFCFGPQPTSAKKPSSLQAPHPGRSEHRNRRSSAHPRRGERHRVRCVRPASLCRDGETVPDWHGASGMADLHHSIDKVWSHNHPRCRLRLWHLGARAPGLLSSGSWAPHVTPVQFLSHRCQRFFGGLLYRRAYCQWGESSRTAGRVGGGDGSKWSRQRFGILGGDASNALAAMFLLRVGSIYWWQIVYRHVQYRGDWEHTTWRRLGHRGVRIKGTLHFFSVLAAMWLCKLTFSWSFFLCVSLPLTDLVHCSRKQTLNFYWLFAVIMMRVSLKMSDNVNKWSPLFLPKQTLSYFVVWIMCLIMNFFNSSEMPVNLIF